MHTQTLEGPLTIFTAAGLREDFGRWLLEDGPLEIDLAAVDEVDCAGLQLLVMLKRSCNASRREVRLINHSQAMVDALELSGLIGYFGDALLTRPGGVGALS